MDSSEFWAKSKQNQLTLPSLDIRQSNDALVPTLSDYM